jgi:hypothetical protein
MHWIRLNDGRLALLLPLLLRELAETSDIHKIGKLYSIGSCVMIVFLLSQQMLVSRFVPTYIDMYYYSLS